MEAEKDNIIVKILFIRKIIRNSNDLSQSRLFAKFGFGLMKYELCCNLIPQRGFKRISTICLGTSKKKTYQWFSKTFQQKKLNIQDTDDYFTQIEQIEEQKIVISGGKQSNQKRFTVHSEKFKALEYQLQFDRFCHRTSYNKKDLIYIVSGVDKNDNFQIQCEVFNIHAQVFQTLSQILCPISNFGCDQADSKIYTFGGFERFDVTSNQIQEYEVNLNA